MSANTTAARSIVTDLLGKIFEQFRSKRARVILEDLPSNSCLLLLDRIQTVSQSPGRVVLQTGAFEVTIDVKIKERVKP